MKSLDKIASELFSEKNFSANGKTHHGKIDITEHLDFKKAASENFLNQMEYDRLIEICQKKCDEMVAYLSKGSKL